MLNVVAIDGPSGAGKSTVARALAARLGWSYIDTGAMYRSVGLKADRLGVECAYNAGYDPRGMSTFLATLKAKEGSYDSGWFKTHPSLASLPASHRSCQYGGSSMAKDLSSSNRPASRSNFQKVTIPRYSSL